MTKRVPTGKSLQTLFPGVAAEWDYERNGSLTPSDVVAGTSRKVWWVCDKGPDHRWEAVVVSRTRIKAGCPCCAGKKASVTNSLAALFPEVAETGPCCAGKKACASLAALPCRLRRSGITKRTRCGAMG